MVAEIEVFDSRDFYFQLAGIDPDARLWNGHSITIEDAPAIREAIASRIHALFLTQDLDAPSALYIVAYFAYRGSEGSTRDLVGRDIIELFNTPEGLLARGQDGVIIPVGGFKSIWKFVQNHYKEILFGMGKAAGVATLVILNVSTGGTCTGVAAVVAGAMGSAFGANEHRDKKPFLVEQNTGGSIPMLSTPLLQPSNVNPFTPKDPFGLFESRMLDPLCFVPRQEIQNDPPSPFTFNPEYGVKFLNDPPCSSDSFGEHARNFGSTLTHKLFHEIAEFGFVLPQFCNEVKEVWKQVVPQSLLLPNDQIFCEASPKGNYDQLIASGHGVIDRLFSTNQADFYASEAKAARDRFIVGVLPPPGQIYKSLAVSKFKEIVYAGQEVAVIAEEFGFTAREIVQLERAGVLEKTVIETVERVYGNHSLRESIQRFKYAETVLRPYRGQYLPEWTIKKLIQDAGIQTFPRPVGIPENFRIKISKEGAGMKYVHPNNEHIFVRVMPGKAHSPNPSQQRPYVVQMQGGKAVDKFGNLVNPESPDAHILLEEYVYAD